MDFAKKKKTALLFLFLLTITFTCNTMKQFQSHINNIIVDTNDVYVCYNLFLQFETSNLLTKVNPKFSLAIKAAIMGDDDLNYCGYNDNSSYF